MMPRPLVRAGLSRLLRAIPPADFTPTTSADAALDEASRLRAKEQADHAAWLRENAESVTVPEHPAVALLRDLEWSGAVDPGSEDESGLERACPRCSARAWNTGMRGTHAPGCEVAAILAGSKPGERALSELLEEAREEGRKEAAAASAPFVPTKQQRNTSALLAALAHREGITERDAIECLFQQSEERIRIAERLAAHAPIGPIVVDGKTWINPLANKMADEGRARTLTAVLDEERAKGREEGAAEERTRAVQVMFPAEALARVKAEAAAEEREACEKAAIAYAEERRGGGTWDEARAFGALDVAKMIRARGAR